MTGPGAATIPGVDERWAVVVDLRVLVLVGALVLALALATLVLSTAARRLDRLHRRADGARAALAEQLVRRAAATDRLARSGLLDPAASVLLAAAAAEALGGGETSSGQASGQAPGQAPGEQVASPPPPPDRARAEGDLTAALRAALTPDVLDDLRSRPEAEGLLGDLATACHRLVLARHISNAAQTQVARRRGTRLVRWARLAGRAPSPRTFDVDDAPPPGLLG
ncbi:hypothetical protein [Pseudokineococcus sp. 1T1Z-3]|uniref:hypothetical protein n=1 Tax=Pseudokineococcus sp. 1T1Z-3 TaxID=3132745 RepID=UPI0030A9E216